MFEKPSFPSKSGGNRPSAGDYQATSVFYYWKLTSAVGVSGENVVELAVEVK